MKKFLALLLAFAYLGSFTLHGVAHATDSKADTCCACQTGSSRAEAPEAPAIAGPSFVFAPLPEAAPVKAAPARLQSPAARGPPASV